MVIPAQRSFPYDGAAGGDAGPYDGDYFAQIQQAFLGAYTRRATAGVLLGVGNGSQESLNVEETSPQSLAVLVRQGWGMVNGRMYQATEDITVSITQNIDGSGDDRIDSIVMQLNLTNNTTRLVAREGTVAAVPVPPTLVQSSTIWEIRIADVTVINLATLITNADIDNTVREYAILRTVKEGGTGISAAALGDMLIASATNTLKAFNLPDGGVPMRDTAEPDNFRVAYPSWETIVTPTILSVAAASIALNAIPARFEDLLLVVRPRSTAGGITTNVTFNADTGNNYSKNSSEIDTAGAESHVVSNNQTSIACVNSCVPSGGTAGYFGHLWLYVTAAPQSSRARVGHYVSNRFADATTHARSEGTWGWENVAAALSSIGLALAAGNFEIGTTYALYGIGRE